MRKIWIAILLMGATLLAQEPQSEFLPVAEVPASEQLPSVPLVIAAYAFVWAAFLFYAWTMWRKLGKVEQELTALSAQISKPRAGATERVFGHRD
jgi:CcmD family protein